MHSTLAKTKIRIFIFVVLLGCLDAAELTTDNVDLLL